MPELLVSGLMMFVSVDEETLNVAFCGATFFTVAFFGAAFFAGFLATVFLVGFFVVM